jgi:hypothetical protein
VKQSLSLLDRLLSVIAGVLFGALLGMLGSYVLMIVSSIDFGLNNVRPGMILGAVIGLFYGLWLPWRWSWLDLIN